MDDFFYKETSQPKLKGVEKAAIFLGEMNPGVASIICGFLSTNELKQIRKAFKKIGSTINTRQEITVLSEALRKGELRGIAPMPKETIKQPARKTYGINQPTEAIADVIATWLQDDNKQ